MNLTEDKWIEETLKKSEDLANDLQPWGHYYRLRAKEMEVLLSFYKIKKVKRILEIGCGNGFFSAVLSKFADEVIAADLLRPDIKTHSVGISKAIGLFKRLDIGNCRIVSCSGERLAFNDKRFDLIFSAYTLEHIRKRGEAMKEVRRVLKDDGEAIFLVPAFMESFLYPFSYYWEIFKKVTSLFFEKEKSAVRAKYVEENDQHGKAGRLNMSDSFWRKFRNSYPNFPMPDPHGEYPSYFSELVRSASFAWFKLMKKNNLRVKEAFTIMLFPKTFSSIFLGKKSLAFYIRTLWINKRFGKNILLKHLGQNLCMILEKDNV